MEIKKKNYCQQLFHPLWGSTHLEWVEWTWLFHWAGFVVDNLWCQTIPSGTGTEGVALTTCHIRDSLSILLIIILRWKNQFSRPSWLVVLDLKILKQNVKAYTCHGLLFFWCVCVFCQRVLHSTLTLAAEAISRPLYGTTSPHASHWKLASYSRLERTILGGQSWPGQKRGPSFITKRK